MREIVAPGVPVPVSEATFPLSEGDPESDEDMLVEIESEPPDDDEPSEVEDEVVDEETETLPALTETELEEEEDQLQLPSMVEPCPMVSEWEPADRP